MSEPLMIPEWICTLVGRLTLDKEALLHQIQTMSILKQESLDSLSEEIKE